MQFVANPYGQLTFYRLADWERMYVKKCVLYIVTRNVKMCVKRMVISTAVNRPLKGTFSTTQEKINHHLQSSTNY